MINLEKHIKRLKKKGLEVVMHMPFRVNGERIQLTKKDVTAEIKVLKILGGLCIKYNIHAIVHPTMMSKLMTDKFNFDRWAKNLLKLKK